MSEMKAMQRLKEKNPLLYFAITLFGFVLFVAMVPVGFIARALWAGLQTGFFMDAD